MTANVAHERPDFTCYLEGCNYVSFCLQLAPTCEASLNDGRIVQRVRGTAGRSKSVALTVQLST